MSEKLKSCKNCKDFEHLLNGSQYFGPRCIYCIFREEGFEKDKKDDNWILKDQI